MTVPAITQAIDNDELKNRIRTRIEIGEDALTVGDQRIHAVATLGLFYHKRGYELAWSDPKLEFAMANALLRALRGARDHGLQPDDYHASLLAALLERIAREQNDNRPIPPTLMIDLDLAATDAFLLFGSHLLAGRVDPEKIDPEWVANRRGMDFAAFLQEALNSGEIESAFESLLPRHPGYQRMQTALTRYRDIAEQEPWPRSSLDKTLKKGARGDDVVRLRERVRIFGFLQEDNAKDPLFDKNLEHAIIDFQKKFGLEPDGVAGPKTLSLLNASGEDLVVKIILNLERWRWLPQSLGDRYILVNIAAFSLELVEEGRNVMDMAVIVGRDYRRTPVFSGKMTHLVLCPYWHVPPSLAIKDKLPLIRKTPAYLAEQKIRVFQGWGSEEREIDPSNVNWSRISASNFHYRLRQDPGPLNALGAVKFMFPNRFNVYLHDTPARELFSKAERAFSSGCIRINKPLDLAIYLLRKNPEWGRDKILATIEQNVERTINLPQAFNVHLLYWTAWAEEDGSVHFRPDVYGRDKTLAQAFFAKPPSGDDGSKPER